MEFSIPENIGDIYYINRFTAIPETQQFRPRRITPIPAIHGTQTAVVTDDLDQYGRVKVKFPWFDEKTSCWIRVSQPMAGKKWGWISLPRVGQEVIVSFEEGNPNRPIITGRVYNDKSMPPYELPANKTQSGIKTCGESCSSKFNELRFEDKQDNEEIFLHAEKDLRCVILNDETREITQNRTVTIKSGNDSLRVDKGKCIIEAQTSIELKVGENSIKIDQQGVTIKAMKVDIQGTATVDVKSPMTSVNADGILTLKGNLTKIN
jgi:type VI secretion system secreted protein VgrG